MKDELDLLKGKGKVMIVLPLKSFAPKEIAYYLNQAIEINTKK